jgi:hypothetical protein
MICPPKKTFLQIYIEKWQFFVRQNTDISDLTTRISVEFSAGGIALGLIPGVGPYLSAAAPLVGLAVQARVDPSTNITANALGITVTVHLIIQN